MEEEGESEEGRASPTTSETEAGAEPAVRDSHDGPARDERGRWRPATTVAARAGTTKSRRLARSGSCARIWNPHGRASPHWNQNWRVCRRGQWKRPQGYNRR